MTDKLKALLVRQIPEPSASVQEHPLIQYIEALEARIAAAETIADDLADLADDVAALESRVDDIENELENGGE